MNEFAKLYDKKQYNEDYYNDEVEEKYATMRFDID